MALARPHALRLPPSPRPLPAVRPEHHLNLSTASTLFAISSRPDPRPQAHHLIRPIIYQTPPITSTVQIGSRAQICRMYRLAPHQGTDPGQLVGTLERSDTMSPTHGPSKSSSSRAGYRRSSAARQRAGAPAEGDRFGEQSRARGVPQRPGALRAHRPRGLTGRACVQPAVPRPGRSLRSSEAVGRARRRGSEEVPRGRRRASPREHRARARSLVLLASPPLSPSPRLAPGLARSRPRARGRCRCGQRRRGRRTRAGRAPRAAAGPGTSRRRRCRARRRR
jgi:hypothetical protein